MTGLNEVIPQEAGANEVFVIGLLFRPSSSS